MPAHPDAPSRPRFREVSADYAKPAVQTAANQVLRACAADLDLPSDVRIRWFVPESETFRKIRERYGNIATPWMTFEAEEPLMGKVDPAAHAELWVRADLSPEEVATTVAYEARHSWQFKRYFEGSRTFALPHGAEAPHVEEDADDYASRHVRRPHLAERSDS